MRFLLILTTFIVAFLSHGLALAQGDGTVYATRYSFGDGSEAFVLKQALLSDLEFDATLQMGASNEVWILNRAQGARGAVLYRNDTGRVFLRVNHVGGATLYPTPDSMGVPVLLDAEYRFDANDPVSTEETTEVKTIEEWSRVYAYAGTKTSRLKKTKESDGVSGNIKFSDWPPSKTAYKTELIFHLSDLMQSRLGENVERIIVKIGEQPRAAQNDADLTIWVNPALGFAGRPSTEKILSQVRGSKG